jgi:hypothetical protein
LGSVAPRGREPVDMPDALTIATLLTLTWMATVAAPTLAGRLRHVVPPPIVRPDVGVGTVRRATEPITVDVLGFHGQRFVGTLHACDETVTAGFAPGVLVLVAFDPADPEQLSLADDIVAVSARRRR